MRVTKRETQVTLAEYRLSSLLDTAQRLPDRLRRFTLPAPRSPLHLLLLFASVLVMAACSGDPGAGQTAEAINATLGTDVANRRMTATYDADRRFVTQSALETVAALA